MLHKAQVQAPPWGHKLPDSAQGKPEGPFQDTHLQVKEEGCWGRLMSPIFLENDPLLFLNERLTGCAPVADVRRESRATAWPLNTHYLMWSSQPLKSYTWLMSPFYRVREIKWLSQDHMTRQGWSQIPAQTWALHQIRRPAKAQKVIQGRGVWAQVQVCITEVCILKEGLSECLLRGSGQLGQSVTFQLKVAFLPTLLLHHGSHFGKFIIRLMQFFLGFYFWILSMNMSSRSKN